MRTTIAIAIFAAGVIPAHAGPYDGCFERTYDKAHLAAHPGQTVTSIILRLKPRDMNDGNNVAAELRFAFRAGKDGHFAVGSCKDEGERLYCGLDQDAGRISVRPDDGGLMLSPISDVRADNASGDENDYITISSSNPEDRNFALRPAPAAARSAFDDDGE